MRPTLTQLWSLGICLLLSGFLFPANGQSLPGHQKSKTVYQKEWQAIDSLIGEGLPQSALKKVNLLLAKARREKNAPQQVKCLLQRMALQSFGEEENFPQIVAGLEKELQTAHFPVKPVLHSLLGEVYGKYVSQHYWSRYEDTAKEPLDEKDLESWPLEKVLAKATAHYEASLTDKELLRQVSLIGFAGILQGEDSLKSKTALSLYDFLVSRTLDFYTDNQIDHTHSRQDLSLKNPLYLSPVDEFIKLKLPVDSLSGQEKALALWQQLLREHLPDADPTWWVQNDIKRLQFSKQKSTLSSEIGDSLFTQTLQIQASLLKNHAASAEYEFALAEALARQGQGYNPFNNAAFQWQLKKSLSLCNRIIDRFPTTPAGRNAAALREQLLRKNLSLEVESVNPPHLPFRQRVRFQNVPKLYYSMYRLTCSQIDAFPSEGEQAEVMAYFGAKKAFRQWQVSLPDEKDLQAHSTEITVDGLPLGQYYLLASADSLATDSGTLAYTRFTVSNLAFVRRNQPDGSQSFLVANRQSGKPVKGAGLGFYQVRGRDLKRVTQTQTDTKGLASVPAIPEEAEESDTVTTITDSYFVLHSRGDTLRFSDEYDYWLSEEEISADTLQTLLFTDRSIYRPGQTIHFKGILVKKEKGRQTIVPNHQVAIRLLDVNHELVDSLQLTTNSFGSCSGSFRAPSGRLNGAMTLVDAFGNEKSIRVEEYKRPTFTARFEPLTRSYRIGDSVRVTGVARTYATAAVDGANVSYRIIRYTQLPAWNQRMNDYHPLDSETEIALDTVITDQHGTFTISFLAQEDSRVEKSTQAVYLYNIYADITDRNGETQSIQQQVKVGYTTLQVQVEMPEAIDGSQSPTVHLLTTTLNEAPVPAKGTLRIYPLLSPGQPVRSRLWEQPDTHSLSLADYRKLFPYDVYEQENEVKSWKKGKEALMLSFDLGKQNPIALEQLAAFPSGEYLVEVTAKDSAGQEARDVAYFTLFQSKKGNHGKHTDHWLLTRNGEGQPGEKAAFLLDIPQPGYVLQEIEKDHRIESATWLKTGNKPLLVETPIEERHRGNFVVRFTFIRQGRIYTSTQQVVVPHRDKKLQVELLTFRDQLQPGQPEEWKLKVKGPAGEKVLAEMAAALYDASLDALQGHDWKQELYPDYQPHLDWSTDTKSFRTSNSEYYGRSWQDFDFEPAEREGLQLNWFGYDYFGGYNTGYQQYQELTYQRQLDRNTARVQQEIAQRGRLLTGKVVSALDSVPLPGLFVRIPETRLFTRTDSSGSFALKIPSRSITLLISHPESGNLAEVEVGTPNQLIIPIDISEMPWVADASITETLEGDANADPNLIIDKVIPPPPPPPTSVGIYSNSDTLSRITIRGSRITIRGLMTQQGEGKIAMVKFVPPQVAADDEIVLQEELKEVAIATETKEEDPSHRAQSIATTRRNFNETAFFYPQLQTDETGELFLRFTLPDALTRWKLLTFAHTRDLKAGGLEREVVAQKDFMVTANPPRFLREGDTLTFTAKVMNLSGKPVSGKASLQLLNAVTMQPLAESVSKDSTFQSFNVTSKESTGLHWTFRVPEGVEGITYRLIAQSGNLSDGEEKTLPVLPDRILVHESLPLTLHRKGTQTYELATLTGSLTNQEAARKKHNLQHQRLILEITPNAAWTVVEALPYLMEFPHECAEQLFSRFYANTLAAHMLKSNPGLKETFTQWQRESFQTSLPSPLEKHPDLKALQLEETPWLTEAIGEKERKKQLAQLFEEKKLVQQQTQILERVAGLQTADGAFPWFTGMGENRYLTSYIVGEIGHLLTLGVEFSAADQQAVNPLVIQSLHYLDKQMHKEFESIQRSNNPDGLAALPLEQAHYLYARSFFLGRPLEARYRKAWEHWVRQAKTQWLTQDLYTQGLLALALHRMGDDTTPPKILKSLKERASQSPESGMYWKSNRSGYHWQQAPIETQALLIEAFSEITKDTLSVEAMKIWLLGQKQTQAWPTTKATAQACYALLLRGKNLLKENRSVSVKLGGETVDLVQAKAGQPGGSGGSLKRTWVGDNIQPGMGKVSLTSHQEGYVTGALHWQYLEKPDRIKATASGLQVQKRLLLQQNVSGQITWVPLMESTLLRVGDLIKVRLELKAEQPMEFIHLKDLRASGLEPVRVLSGYEYRHGLGYYQTTRDAATHFFMDYLPKGKYVLEYELRVTHAGNFSAGLATIQCMYAPEYTSHSQGAMLKVD